MAAESTITLNLTTHADTAALDRTQEAMTRTGKAADRLAGDQDKVTKGGRNNAMAMLTVSRAFQDAQIGTVTLSQSLGGMVNNVEALAQSLGAGMGLASALTITVAGVAALLPLLNGSGDAAEAAAKKNHEMAQEAGRTAAASAKEAESVALSTAAAREYAEALEGITEAGKRANAALENRLRLLQATRQAKLAESDAQAAADLAGVDSLQARGVISPQEAERRRADIETRAAATRHAAEQEESKDREGKAIADANAKREEAAKLAGEAERMRPKAAGLLTAEERKRAVEEKAAAAMQVNDFGPKLPELAEAANAARIRREAYRSENNSWSERLEREKNLADSELRIAREKTQSGRDKYREADAALEADKAARERTGLDGREDFEKGENERRKKQADELLAAGKLDAQAEAERITRGGAARAFSIRQGLRGTVRDTRLGEMDRRDTEERERMEKARLADKWRVAEGNGAQMDQSATTAIAAAQQAGASRAQMAQLLLKFIEENKKEQAEIRALVEAMRNGH